MNRQQTKPLVGAEVRVTQPGVPPWHGKVWKGCCSEHVFVERPVPATERLSVDVRHLEVVTPLEPKAAAMDKLDEALFACEDAGWTADEVIAHIAGHGISDG